MGSKRSIYVHGSAIGCSSVAYTNAKSSATKVHVGRAGRPSSMRSAAIADALHQHHHYRAVRSRLHAAFHAPDRKRVGIHKSSTIATVTMKRAQSALSLWRGNACAESTRSRTSRAGYKMFDAARFAAESCVVALITAASRATGLTCAKKRTHSRVSSLVESPRKCAGIPTKTSATRRSVARKTSRVTVRSSLPAPAKRRSRR